MLSNPDARICLSSWYFIKMPKRFLAAGIRKTRKSKLFAPKKILLIAEQDWYRIVS